MLGWSTRGAVRRSEKGRGRSCWPTWLCSSYGEAGAISLTLLAENFAYRQNWEAESSAGMHAQYQRVYDDEGKYMLTESSPANTREANAKGAAKRQASRAAQQERAVAAEALAGLAAEWAQCGAAWHGRARGARKG